MPRGLCKCGGHYRKADVSLPDGYQTAFKCQECSSIIYRRKRSPNKPKVEAEPSHNLTALEIGQGVMNYVAYLENMCVTLQKQRDELIPLAEERDELKRQIIEMQEKYNEAKVNGSVSIPKKMF